MPRLRICCRPFFNSGMIGNKRTMASLSAAQVQRGLPVAATAQRPLNPTKFVALPAYDSGAVLTCEDGGDSIPRFPGAAAVKAVKPLDLEADTGYAAGLYPDISQGGFNTCTAFACSHAFALVAALTSRGSSSSTPFLSPLYAYFYERVRECSLSAACKCPSPGATCDTPCLDCGSLLSSAVAVYTLGVAPLEAWPMSQSLNTQPSAAAGYQAPLRHFSKTTCIPPGDVGSVVASLESSAPVVCFLNLSPNQVTWMQGLQISSGVPRDLQTVMMPSPGPGATSGHCVLLVGVNQGGFIMRNSFGQNWGAQGRCIIPFAVFTSKSFVHSSVSVQECVY